MNKIYLRVSTVDTQEFDRQQPTIPLLPYAHTL